MAVVAIFGATASGKSAAALAVAERLDGEIVSCDALQLYAGLPILSNQPTAAERARVPHHLVGIWPLAVDGDVARYATAAHAAIDDVLARGRVAIVTGGTGLYLRAALTALDLPPEPPPSLRERLQADYDTAGAAAAHARLTALDPRAAARIHPNDRRRVVRALELQALGSSLAPAADRLWSLDVRHPTRVHGLRVERATLHARIEARTAAMLAGGALAELAAARAAGPISPNASRTLGVDELGAVLDGRATIEEARTRMVERTRSYARRQEIWMRKIPGLVLVDDAAAVRPPE
jgi:tRNA dimethylallyltransferase